MVDGDVEAGGGQPRQPLQAVAHVRSYLLGQLADRGRVGDIEVERDACAGSADDRLSACRARRPARQRAADPADGAIDHAGDFGGQADGELLDDLG